MASIPPSVPESAGAACPHCGDTHPPLYTHCPKTGRSLRAGTALIGRIIANRYKIVGVLGEGGMGAVYLAEHLMIGRKVALKRLHPELAADASAVQRFQREARAAAATGHEHIVEILDLGYADDGAPFLVMEHLRGQTLASVIKTDAPLDPARACRVVGQVLAALDAVHKQGIVHRDLKPDNVFLTRRGGASDYVKVLDFGISKMKQEDGGALDLTKTGVMMGTPYYMSPEQARGMKAVDAAVDLYAAGVILYESLTGRLPYQGDNYHALLQAILRTEPIPPARLAPGIDAALEAVVMRALSKTPSARFGTAAQMLDALLPFGAPPLTESLPEGNVVSATARTARADAPAAGRAHTEALGEGGRTLLTARTSAANEPPARPTGLARPLGAEPAAGPARSATSSAERERPVIRAPSSSGIPRAGKTSSPGRERPTTADGGPRFFFAASDDWQGERPRASLREGHDATGSEPGVHDAPWPAPIVTAPHSEPRRRSLEPAHAAGSSTISSSTLVHSAPGTEPTLKGAFFVATLEHLDERFGHEARERALAALDPALRARLSGVILPMAWLPTSTFDALLRSVERELGAGDGSTATAIGRAIAEREAQATHRLFMQTATPSLAVERIPHFFRSYHPRGDCRPHQSGATNVRLELDSGAPESVLYASVFASFFQRFLELAGAKDVKGLAVASRAQGDKETVIALRWR